MTYQIPEFYLESSKWMLNVYVLFGLITSIIIIRAVWLLIAEKKKFGKITIIAVCVLLLVVLSYHLQYKKIYTITMDNISGQIRGNYDTFPSYQLTKDELDELSDLIRRNELKITWRNNPGYFDDESILKLYVYSKNSSDSLEIAYNSSEHKFYDVRYNHHPVEMTVDSELAEFMLGLNNEYALERSHKTNQEEMLRALLLIREKEQVLTSEDYKAYIEEELALYRNEFTDEAYESLLSKREFFLLHDILKDVGFESHVKIWDEYSRRTVGNKITMTYNIDYRVIIQEHKKTYTPKIICTIERNPNKDWRIEYIHFDFVEVENLINDY